MKYNKQSFAVAAIPFVVLLAFSTGTLNARDADLAPFSIAAAQTAKQQCTNACRARYRDCLSKKQIPSFECQKALVCLGGNLAVAMSDPQATFEAMRGLDLAVHIATKLNRSHLLLARKSFILPCLGRTEIDMQPPDRNRSRSRIRCRWCMLRAAVSSLRQNI